MATERYKWQFCSLGGTIRVRICSGEDIAHLGELDRTCWTVLGCPASELRIDPRTLKILDVTGDGYISADDVMKTAKGLTPLLKDKDLILDEDGSIALDAIDITDIHGRRIYNSAKKILENKGCPEAAAISIEDVSDGKNIFDGTRFNGDGVITPSSTDDEAIKQVIRDCMTTIGHVPDRSGEDGIDSTLIGNFYSACSDYSSWYHSGESPETLPYNDKTSKAYETFAAIRDKVDDFFTRCRLIRFDSIAAKEAEVVITSIEQIEACPIAKPEAAGIIHFNALNPAWQGRFIAFAAIVLGNASEDGSLDEAGWNAAKKSFTGYETWLHAEKGKSVASLGINRINDILLSVPKDSIDALIAEDLALKDESEAIEAVLDFLLLKRDFFRILKNFVIMSDFYERAPGKRALFEQGRLYIDQRCCDLCIKVNDPSRQADIPALSGMFLIYCQCTSKSGTETMNIVAAMTDGDIASLRPGKNGLFYDLEENEWNATVTRIVDNPINLGQAFWAPYRKAGQFCAGLLNKSAAEKDAKVTAGLQAQVKSAAQTAPSATAGAAGTAPTDPAKKQQAFDIAKFAGIFAAIGMAIGYIGSFITSILTGIKTTPFLIQLAALCGIVIVISGPSCLSAWLKLRKRDLGPILNANGWAINARISVNILFGKKLTTVAKYPKLRLADPYKDKPKAWKIIVPIAILALVIAVIYLVKVCR